MILNNREVRKNMPDFAFEVAPNDAATCKSLIKKFETEGLELTLDVAGTTARCVRPQQKITAWLRKCFSLLLSFNRTHV